MKDFSGQREQYQGSYTRHRPKPKPNPGWWSWGYFPQRDGRALSDLTGASQDIPDWPAWDFVSGRATAVMKLSPFGDHGARQKQLHLGLVVLFSTEGGSVPCFSTGFWGFAGDLWCSLQMAVFFLCFTLFSPSTGLSMPEFPPFIRMPVMLDQRPILFLYDLILTNYICMILFPLPLPPTKITFWDTGDQDFNIWMDGKGIVECIRPMTM